MNEQACGHKRLNQQTGTCWFNAAMNALMLSDRMREVFLDKYYMDFSKQTGKVGKEQTTIGEFFDKASGANIFPPPEVPFKDMLEMCPRFEHFQTYFYFMLYLLFIRDRQLKLYDIYHAKNPNVSAIGAKMLTKNETRYFNIFLFLPILQIAAIVYFEKIRPRDRPLSYILATTLHKKPYKSTLNEKLFGKHRVFGIIDKNASDIICVEISRKHGKELENNTSLLKKKLVYYENEYELQCCTIHIEYHPIDKKRQVGHAIAGFKCKNKEFIFDSNKNSHALSEWSTLNMYGYKQQLGQKQFSIKHLYVSEAVYLRSNWKPERKESALPLYQSAERIVVPNSQPRSANLSYRLDSTSSSAKSRSQNEQSASASSYGSPDSLDGTRAKKQRSIIRANSISLNVSKST